MEKKLSLNEKVDITSFSYYAYPLAIMTADNRIGEVIATFELYNSDEEDFRCIGNLEKVADNRWSAMSTGEYDEANNSCLYREIKEHDSIELKICYQRYTNSWGAVNLFITDNEECLPSNDESFLFRFGKFIYNGINLYKNGKEIGEPIFNQEDDIFLKFVKDGKNISFFLLEKGKQFEIYHEKCSEFNEICYMGVQVKHGDNMFAKWFFQNYIQLSCDVTNRDRRLEYHYGALKHWDCNIYNYFLDTQTVVYDDLSKLGIIKYLKKSIDRQQYIILPLNQRFLSGREEYGLTDHYHSNLIYGYSQKKKAFKVFGYLNSGKLHSFAVRFSDVRTSIEKGRTELKLITYKQDAYFYEFKDAYVREVFREYLYGINSKIHTQYLFPADNRKYGIEIYDELASDMGINVLISDRRISHLLWEHKKIMIRRIRYMQHLRILSDKLLEDAICRYESIEKKVFNLKNILLKIQLRPEKANREALKECLREICEAERVCLTMLLESWPEGVSDDC